MKRAGTFSISFLLLCILSASQMGGCGSDSNPDPSGSAPPTAGSVETESLPSGSFSILSYNVAGLPDILSQSQPAEFTVLISPLLNEYDLVLVQEDFFYHSDLESAATHPFQSTPQTSYQALANDGLNRFSQSEFRDFQRETWEECSGWVDDANDCLSAKGFSFARHEIAKDVYLDVYNLHADAGGSESDMAAREAQIEQFLAFVLANSAGNALIVAGDTNLHGFDDDDEPLLQKLLIDAGLTDSARFLGEEEKIDRIMFRSSEKLLLEPTHWRKATEFVNAAGTPLSDHEGIHVDMSWTVLP